MREFHIHISILLFFLKIYRNNDIIYHDHHDPHDHFFLENENNVFEIREFIKIFHSRKSGQGSCGGQRFEKNPSSILFLAREFHIHIYIFFTF